MLRPLDWMVLHYRPRRRLGAAVRRLEHLLCIMSLSPTPTHSLSRYHRTRIHLQSFFAVVVLVQLVGRDVSGRGRGLPVIFTSFPDLKESTFAESHTRPSSCHLPTRLRLWRIYLYVLYDSDNL